MTNALLTKAKESIAHMRCFFVSDNMTTANEIRFEKFQKDGETYLRAIKYLVKLTPKHITLHFDNLLSGNTFLGIVF